MLVVFQILLAFALMSGYLVLNVLIAAWILRNLRLWGRRVRMALRMDRLSTTRAWVTITSHLTAAVALFCCLLQPMQLITLALALLGYVFFITALTVSVVAQVAIARRLWDDPFAKLCTLAAPIPAVYLAKGYGARWLGHITGSSASNFPMAYTAATCFTLMVGMLIALSFALLAFEVLFIMTLGKTKVVGPKVFSKATLDHAFSIRWPQERPERLLSKVIWQRAGAAGLLLCTFLACVIGTHAIGALVSQRLGGVLLAAIAFEFDGAPARRCELNDEELRLTKGDEPILKAAFLSTAQDKALLLQRGSKLFEPVVLRELTAETDGERKLKFGRVVECYQPKKP